MPGNTERTQVGWGFWLWWVLASAVGFAAVGAGVGIAQWFVLRRHVSRAGWWILASAVGFIGGYIGVVALVMAVDDAVFESLGDASSLYLSFAVVGAGVGIAQWFVLRRHVSRAGWWVLASTVGYTVAGAGVFRAVGAGFLGGSTDGGGLLLSLALYGAITGGVMVWLLWDPDMVKEEPSIPEYFP